VIRRLLKPLLKRVLRHYGYQVTIVRTSRDDLAARFRPYRAKVQPARADLPRVLHVIGNFYTGGSARLVVDLVEQLGDRFAQTVITRDMSSPPDYVGLDIEIRPWFHEPEDVLQVLLGARPDLVHFHYLGPSFSRIGVGDWWWCVSLFRAFEQLKRPVIENVNIPIAPFVSDAVDCYVFVSDFVRERFGYPQSRSLTVYPGSDVRSFRPTGNDRADDCIGMVYRLEGDKLDRHAIDVFVEAVKRRPGTRVMIVGGGPLLSPYQAAVTEAGLEDAFTFTGYVAYDDLRRYFGRMRVFVAPIHTESFGHVVPLAMSMGIPVAAYATGALPEILNDPTVLAPPGDASALADVVCGLLEDKSRSLLLGAANRERAVALFSREAMAERYAALYEDLLSEAGAR
jgi:glycosyltransferase involved in cell wall biosynthesis